LGGGNTLLGVEPRGVVVAFGHGQRGRRGFPSDGIMFDFFGYAWVSLALTAALVWVVTPTASAAGGDAQHDRVDPAVRYQTVDNFAASDAWTMQAVRSG
jgi:hypothetical protein